MNCEDIALILDDGDIPALDGEVRRAVAYHVADCPVCARVWSPLANLAKSPLPPVPPRFADQCAALVVAESQPGGKRAAHTRLIVLGCLVAGAAAAGILTMQLSDRGTAGSHRSVAVAAPVTIPEPVSSPSVIANEAPVTVEVAPTTNGAAALTPSVSAPPSLNRPSRPDLGYYTHPTRQYGVAGELFFGSLTPQVEADRQASINKIVAITQVDEFTANNFLDYVKLAMADLRAYQNEAASEPCRQRDGIRTIKQLADAITSVDVSVETRRVEMTRRSETILGAPGMRNLEEYLSRKDRNGKPHVERNEEILLATGKPLAEILKDICTVR